VLIPLQASLKRGFHTLGRIAGTLSEVVSWSVHELELLGSGVVNALQTALRVRATYDNSANSPSADIRAADAEAIIKQGQVNSLTGVRAAVTKQGGTVANAYGVKVEDVSGATNNYALHSGLGMVHLGDTLELKAPTTVLGTPATGEMRVYPKTDGKLYAKNSNSAEYLLGATVLSLFDVTLSSSDVFSFQLSNHPDGLACVHLELIMLLRTTSTNTADWAQVFYNGDLTNSDYYTAGLYGGTAGHGYSSYSGSYTGLHPTANAASNRFGITRVFIPFYGGGHYKLSMCTNHDWRASNTSYHWSLTHQWNGSGGTPGTQAISSIDIRPDSYGSGYRFAAGSRVQVVGYKF
jgi:hypothetical protein